MDWERSGVFYEFFYPSHGDESLMFDYDILFVSVRVGWHWPTAMDKYLRGNGRTVGD